MGKNIFGYKLYMFVAEGDRFSVEKREELSQVESLLRSEENYVK